MRQCTWRRAHRCCVVTIGPQSISHAEAASGAHKALANRALGVRSLVQLGASSLSFQATVDTQADASTKCMGAKTLARQREFVGCAPLHGTSE